MESFSFKGLSVLADVIKVIDGDTICISFPIHLTIPGTSFEKNGHYKFNIRLFGIDTCELKSKIVEEASLAKQAKEKLEEFVQNSNGKIFVKLLDYDKYGRILGECYHRDYETQKDTNTNLISFNQVLINNKLAKPYFGGSKDINP
jgi:endonuclease YncB( thermonuclease family)